MNADNNIQELWDLFIADQASPEQVDQLFHYIKTVDDGENMIRFKEALEKVPRVLQNTDDTVIDAILGSIIPPVRRISFIQRWGWVAASVIVLAAASFFWLNNRNKPASSHTSPAVATIAPGRNGAILTLADGSQMVLDSLGNGVIASQKGAKLLMKDGRLAYDPSGEITGAMTYNTMTTPRGRQFRLTLPDGTLVWLNAASAIRFPTAFSEKARSVSVTGEAYFEVTTNPARPFVVKVDDKEEIKVLGTSFNVNAYGEEENITTTLVDGSVRVETSLRKTRDPAAVTLKPGQQALLQSKGQTSIVRQADIDQVLAWKNGLFNFDNASLQQIMRQLERWYNIEVVYDNGVPQVALMGEITRGVPLDDLLAALKKLGVHYRQEGRKLIILQ